MDRGECPLVLKSGTNCAITRFAMAAENQDYIFEILLERLQLFQLCQSMLKTAQGWRRDFYQQQLRKTVNKIRKMIEAWPVKPRWNR
jgi:hypothetical protein